jgi:hypothetical protein
VAQASSGHETLPHTLTHFDFNLFIACARSAKIIHHQLLMACAVVNKNKQEHAEAHTST